MQASRSAFKAVSNDEAVAVSTCCDGECGQFTRWRLPVRPKILARPAMAYTHGLAKAGSKTVEDGSLTRDCLSKSMSHRLLISLNELRNLSPS